MALGDLDTRWKNPQGSTPDQLYLWAQELIKELRKGDYLGSGPATGSITNAQLADMAAWTIKMRNNAAAGAPQDQTINDLTELAGIAGNADFLPYWDASGAVMRKVKPDDIIAGLVNNVPGIRLLTNGNASGASLGIVLTNYTGFRALKFVLSSWIPATDDVELWMRFSTNAGSSYDAGATDYSYAAAGLFNNATAANFASAGNTHITIAGSATAGLAVSNVSGEGGVDAEITLYDQTVARWSRVNFQSGQATATSTNATHVTANGCGGRLTAQDTDAVQFLFESGNITSGKYAVYGLL